MRQIVGGVKGSETTRTDETKKVGIATGVKSNQKKTISTSENCVFHAGTLIEAQWDDDNWYKAKIINKTDHGYWVNYFEFGESQEVPYERIRGQIVINWLNVLGLGGHLSSSDMTEHLTMKYLMELSINDLGHLLQNLGFRNDEAIIIKQSLDVYQWLFSLELADYFLDFEKNKYNNISFIRSLRENQIEQMMSTIRLDLAARQIIKHNLKDHMGTLHEDKLFLDDDVIVWLMQHDLQHLAKPMLESGYRKMTDICLMDQEKLTTMINSLHCTSMEELKIRRNIRHYKSSKKKNDNTYDVQIDRIAMIDMTTSDIVSWLQCLNHSGIAQVVEKRNLSIIEFADCAKNNFVSLDVSILGLKYKQFKKAYRDLETNGYLRRQWFDSYQIIRPLGSGRFGKTYLVKKTSQKFALKHILTPDEKQSIAADKEIKALKCIDSPNVVSFVESFRTNEGLAIVMQFCQDGSLEDRIERGKITPQCASRLLMDIITGLQAFHSREMVHRDIKPDNLLLHNGTVLIGDLGLSRNLDDGKYKIKMAYVYYSAPEVQRTHIFSTASDIWSFGCVLLTMISAKLMEDRKPFLFSLRQKKIIEIIDEDVGSDSSELAQLAKMCLKIEHTSRAKAEEIFSQLKLILTKTQTRDAVYPMGKCTERSCPCEKFIIDLYTAGYCDTCSHTNIVHH